VQGRGLQAGAHQPRACDDRVDLALVQAREQIVTLAEGQVQRALGAGRAQRRQRRHQPREP
jgi:hypothetical protein